jgi:hypothetical protein
MTSAAGNDLYDAATGGDQLFQTEIFDTSQSTQSMMITGLDPQVMYRVQILHGDSRGFNYNPTNQTYTIDGGQSTVAPLQFNTSPSNANTITPVIVAGTTSLRIDMPNGGGRGPSFSGLLIEAKQVAPPTPPPSPDPLPPINARFVRGSVRLVGSGQTFDIAYDDADASTQGLGTGGVVLAGPRGFGAVATLVSLNSRRDGPGLIATYRVEGVSVTGSYDVSVRGQHVANVTLFYLRPVLWDVPDDADVPAGARRRHVRRHR